jgi:ABC-type branched-subunit amino acid transport system substrate-binding protein
LRGLGAAALAAALGACSSFPGADLFSTEQPQPAGPPVASTEIGAGRVKVALILPLTAAGNAGAVAQSMRNAAELALTEFNAPNVQLLIKDDNGSSSVARQRAQEALDEGAEIILGPLFSNAVVPVGQAARGRNIPVIAFSTDSSVAARGVYLLSFLPETDVERIIDYSASRGKKSFAALIPENAYGNVAEAAFRQAVARQGGRVVALERYPADRNIMGEAARRVAQALPQADALFIPDGPDGVTAMAQALTASGANLKRVQLLGTGLWDDPRIASEAALQGAWYPAPDPSGYRGFSNRYRAKFGADSVRTATLAYDAVSLVAALVKTQGPQRFSEQTLTTPSGFSGVDGVFRFKPEGTNERGLSIVRVTSSGPQQQAPAPKAFTGSAT